MPNRISPPAIAEAPISVRPLHSLLASTVKWVGEPQGEADGIIVGRWPGPIEIKPRACGEATIFPPCAVTSEIQQIVVDATSGTWELTFGGDTTGPLAFDIDPFDVATAIVDLTSVPEVTYGDIIVTGGPGDDGGTTPYVVTFTGDLAEIDVPDIVAASIDLAGGAATATASVLQDAGLELLKDPAPDNPPNVIQNPYEVVVAYKCSSWGFEENNYEEMALETLMLGKSKAIEFEFWQGLDDPTNQSLVRSTPNDDDHVLNPGGAAAPVPVSPGFALILFAQALANCGTGQRGMIHATPALLERWLNATAVTDVPLDWTCLDLPPELSERIDGPCIAVTPGRYDIIVGGSGYPGTGPLGQPPPSANHVWAYATGLVHVRVGDTQLIPDNLNEALDRSTNEVVFRGECAATAYHDGCCSFAVLVDLCGTV